MIWATIPNDERLRLWKVLRDESKGLSAEIQAEGIAKFCSHMPIGSRSIDYYSPEDWPTPWEILYHGSFCTSSISLLIFYTFVLINDTDKIELYLVEDSDDIYLLPVINDLLVLNYELSKVSKLAEIKDHFKILKIFTKDKIKPIT